MKKTENSNLLVQIIQPKIPTKLNELKNNCLYLANESITTTELAEALGKPIQQIIAFFWEKGQVVTQNQSLSTDLLNEYCQSKKITIKKKSGLDFAQIIQEYLDKITPKNSQLIERPPVVSIMGHIDHGKTTLLDTIRQTNVQKREVGGITQKITVSQVEFQGKKITFLDTPGHSDFIKMRQRGISLTDLVVLVIDANDGIMPQTLEIIKYLQDYRTPVIAFINHKKPTETNNESNLNRLRTQLQEKNLTPLEWGGETILISGSAKDRENINYLLENILLLTDCRANPQQPGHGLVIDSYLHPQTSSRITEVLVQGGTIQEKDHLFLNGKLGKVKILYELGGKKINSAQVGDIVQIIGCNFATELGDRFLIVTKESNKEIIVEQLTNYLAKKDKINPISVSKEKKNINLILLTDSQNALEALTDLVKKKSSNDCLLAITHTAVGNLNNFTIDLAKITQSTILSFGLSLNAEQKKTLKSDNIPFFASKLIYEIADKLMEIIGNQQEVIEVEEIVGKARVEKTFSFSKVGHIAGCQVISGKINRNNRVYVLREKGKEKIFTGSIQSLESNKEKKTEVISGQECGIVLHNFDDFQTGDEIVAFQIIKKAQK